MEQSTYRNLALTLPCELGNQSAPSLDVYISKRWFPERYPWVIKLVKGACQSDEKVLEIVMMVTQHCECIQCNCTVRFKVVKMVNLMCILPQLKGKNPSSFS